MPNQSVARTDKLWKLAFLPLTGVSSVLAFAEMDARGDILETRFSSEPRHGIREVLMPIKA
jgi:hypothetical protein